MALTVSRKNNKKRTREKTKQANRKYQFDNQVFYNAFKPCIEICKSIDMLNWIGDDGLSITKTLKR